jgi:hypothetical protein
MSRNFSRTVRRAFPAKMSPRSADLGLYFVRLATMNAPDPNGDAHDNTEEQETSRPSTKNH